MSKSFAYIVFFATALFFGLFFIWPITTTVKEAFIFDGKFTLDFVSQVFQDPLYVEGLVNAFLLALCSTLGCLVIAMPLAVVANKYLFPGKALLGSLVLVPLILPPFVGAIGVKQILGQEGALNILLSRFGMVDMSAPPDWLGDGRFWGIVVMNALHLYPILYLNITAALANLDPAMEEAAQNLGATGWRRFRQNHPAADHARHIRRRDDRIYLVVHRTRRPADVRLRPGHLGADFQRHQRPRRQSPALRPRRGHASRLGAALRRSGSTSSAAIPSP